MDCLFVRFVLKSFIHRDTYLCNFTVHVLPVFGAAIQVSAGKNDTKYNINFELLLLETWEFFEKSCLKNY